MCPTALLDSRRSGPRLPCLAPTPALSLASGLCPCPLLPGPSFPATSTVAEATFSSTSVLLSSPCPSCPYVSARTDPACRRPRRRSLGSSQCRSRREVLRRQTVTGNTGTRHDTLHTWGKCPDTRRASSLRVIPRQHRSLPSQLTDAAHGRTRGQERPPNNRRTQDRARDHSGRNCPAAYLGTFLGKRVKVPGPEQAGTWWRARCGRKQVAGAQLALHGAGPNLSVSGLPHLNKEAPTSQCKAKQRLARRRPWDPPAPGSADTKPVAQDRHREEGAFALRNRAVWGGVCGACGGHDRRPRSGG